jgi:hypothetical protein
MRHPTHILRIFLLFMVIVIGIAIIRLLTFYGLTIAAGIIGYLIGRSQQPNKLRHKIILNSRYGKTQETHTEETDITSPYPENIKVITRAEILGDPRSGAHTMRGDE